MVLYFDLKVLFVFSESICSSYWSPDMKVFLFILAIILRRLSRYPLCLIFNGQPASEGA